MIKCVNCGKELEPQENQNYIFCPKCGTKNIVDETNLLTNNDNQNTPKEPPEKTDSINKEIKKETDESSKNAIKVGILAFLLKYLRFIIAGLFLIISVPIWIHYAFNGPGSVNQKEQQSINETDVSQRVETTKSEDNSVVTNSSETTVAVQPSAPDDKNLRTVNIHIDVMKNLIFSKYDVDIYLDQRKQGTIKHGKSGDFSLKLSDGKYEISFRSAKETDQVITDVYINVDRSFDIFYEVHCESDRVNVTLVKYDYHENLKDGEVKIDFISSDFKDEYISNVVAKLEHAGFTNIIKSCQYDVTESSYSYHKVISVKINNRENYVPGEIFKKSDAVYVLYHEKKVEQATPNTTSTAVTSEPEVSFVAYHSSHNKEIAQQGNSGIYAYRSRGGSYYIYYLINFDKGYVYRFRNDEDTGMATKIVSGDLNSYILLRYKSGKEVWENALHFKYKNRPETLILQDDDGFETSFYTEDIDNDFVSLFNSKTFYDYSAN